jgi:hypothetical protein
MIKQNKYNGSLVANLDEANEFYSQLAAYYSEYEGLFDSVKTEKVSAEYNTIEYCSGEYTGYIYDGMPWGEGTFTSKNGKKVFAKFNGYYAKGENIPVDNDSLYTGELIISSGEMKLNGYGKLMSRDMTIEGHFSFNILHGPAKVVYNETGDFFEGNYVYGKRDGTGKLIKADSVYIEGIWNDEICSSFVKIGYPNGNLFTGIQLEGKPRLGKLEYTNGDIYTGGFHRSGAPMGDGQLFVAQSKNVLTGFFYGHNISAGILTTPDGTVVNVVWAEKYNCLLSESYYLTCNKFIDEGSTPWEEVEKQKIDI